MYQNVLKVALDCETFGAQGITVHPRPDERHIRYSDVYALKPEIKTEFNIEGYPCEKFIDLVLKVKPTQVTLVPDAPDAMRIGTIAKRLAACVRAVDTSPSRDRSFGGCRDVERDGVSRCCGCGGV